MLCVRPARLADLDVLERIACAAHPVLHSLPCDRRALESRIALSEDSFRAEVDFPGEEFYLFVPRITRTQGEPQDPRAHHFARNSPARAG